MPRCNSTVVLEQHASAATTLPVAILAYEGDAYNVYYCTDCKMCKECMKPLKSHQFKKEMVGTPSSGLEWNYYHQSCYDNKPIRVQKEKATQQKVAELREQELTRLRRAKEREAVKSSAVSLIVGILSGVLIHHLLLVHLFRHISWSGNEAQVRPLATIPMYIVGTIVGGISGGIACSEWWTKEGYGILPETLMSAMYSGIASAIGWGVMFAYVYFVSEISKYGFFQTAFDTFSAAIGGAIAGVVICGLAGPIIYLFVRCLPLKRP